MKLCKKIMLAFLAIIALITCMFSITPSVHAEEVDDTPNFDEDFEAYEINGGGQQLEAKWTNSWFKKTGDFDEVGCNDEKFSIVADPANPDNKVLYIDTKTSNESFFFLTLKDIFVKNFELTYDYYVAPGMTADESPWFGITCRKPIDGRYNGVTNVQLLTRSWGPEGINVDFYRAVNDSHAPVAATGPNGEGAPLGFTAADTDGSTINGVWLKVKISVIDSEFKIYINDKFVGMCNITKKSALNYGYVSLVSCVHRTYVDNVHLENLDEEPYTPEEKPDTPTVQAPTMENTEYTYVPGQDLEVNVSLYGEAVTELKQAANVLLTKHYTVEGDKVIISNDFLSGVTPGRKAFVITTAGGNVMFYVTIADNSEPTPNEPTPNEPTPETPQPEESGCGGSIVASIGSIAILSLGVLLLKRKED